MLDIMAAHLFNESGQMQEVDIPDIFDVLEGGEDESAVKFLLGFNAEDAASESANEILNNNGLVQQVLASPLTSPSTLLTASPASTTSNSTTKTVLEKTPARVIVQIEPPPSVVNNVAPTVVATSTASAQGLASPQDFKTEKPRKREPVDPSRCIYACESCGKAFTTKFNLKRHINMHCSRSREAGVPIQGPPSASQPSRKHKTKEDTITPNTTILSNNTSSVTSGPTQLKVRRVSSSSQVVVSNAVTTSSSSNVTMVKTVPVTTKVAYPDQGPLTVQLAVNAQGQLTARNPSSVVQKPSLPVQPLPESAVQIIQSLGGAVAVSTGNTQRIVRVINAPQIIATQSRAGITTGATVQLQAIPVSSSNVVTFPQQPLPLVQQIGTRQIVLSTAPSLTKVAVTTARPSSEFLPSTLANNINITPVTSNVTASNFVTSTTSAADLIYRSIVSSKATSPSLTPLQAVVTSSTISSPTCGFNDGPPADLFDSEDGDALSVATTTETPTPPPSLNGDPILPTAPIGIKSLPLGDKEIIGDHQKVVVIQQQPQAPALPSLPVALNDLANDDDMEDDEGDNVPMTLPSNRFHGQLTSIPKGWLRKVVSTGPGTTAASTGKGFQKVFYYNPVGKRFSCQEEVDQYFARLGYSVPMSLFNFELPKLVDEDDDEDEDEDDDEDDLDEAATVNKTVQVVKVTSNAKGEATVTPTTSTLVALPVATTVVTRADTTVDQSVSSSPRVSCQSLSPSSTVVTSSTPKPKAISMTLGSSVQVTTKTST